MNYYYSTGFYNNSKLFNNLITNNAEVVQLLIERHDILCFFLNEYLFFRHRK